MTISKISHLPPIKTSNTG